MNKIKCIRDRDGALIPIDKIESVSKTYCSVMAGGCSYDISSDTKQFLLSVFEEVKQ